MRSYNDVVHPGLKYTTRTVVTSTDVTVTICYNFDHFLEPEKATCVTVRTIFYRTRYSFLLAALLSLADGQTYFLHF